MRVLLCVDDDPVLKDVLAAMEWSVELPPAWNELVVLHVVPRHSSFLLGSDAPRERRGEALLMRVWERLSPLHAGVRSVLAGGDPAQEIVRTADEVEADLIVMGALGARRDFLLGSVSQKVASVAPTDVLVVRERSSKGAEMRDRGRAFRALVAVDGSLGSEAAIDSFACKLRARQASTRVVHVVESLPSLWEVPRERGPAPDAFGDLDRLDLRSREVLVRARESLASRGLDAECERRRGSPAGEILEAAREYGADVIVVGSRGHSGIRDVLLGTVTRRVLRHAPCTVLCARGWAFESGGLSREWTSQGWEPEAGMA